MVVLRIGLAQVNCTVGSVWANSAAIVGHTRRAAADGAQLVVFPELAITGYPPEDLVLRTSFRSASRAAVDTVALELAAAGLAETAVVVGYVDEAAGPRNAAAFIHRGRVVARYYKHHLPNYGVFDERRYFIPGRDLVVVRHLGVDIALTICEDVWQDGGPFTVAGLAGVGLVININGSPYERNKDDTRLPLLQRRAAEAGAPVVYVNAVGGQDELVFDGDSMVVAPDGATTMRAPQYVEAVYVVDVETAPAVDPAAQVIGAELTVTRVLTQTAAPLASTERTSAAPAWALARPLSDEAQVWGAIVVGIRDYVVKNAFRSVVLGLSGGIDSAVVAALAADAIGAGNVHGVSLPSAYSSDHSRSDAADLAERIGLNFRVVPIAPMVDAYVAALSLTGLAEENVQARVRGTTLMALSNAEGHLVLATGNKSELAVGYSTIYGDAVGGFAPIKDVPKSLVWKLASWRNDDAAARGLPQPITPNSITKAPSAELRPDQLDSDSLPDYDVLDAILERYIDRDADIEEIVASGFERGLVLHVTAMVDGAEWKRRQYPPGPKISFKAFGRDRRLPITNGWRPRQ
ncbi:MAG: NAD+ synthase [Actinomycetota bacterium]|nr:NAD+ synthase [Actinomycetota bacterium]